MKNTIRFAIFFLLNALLFIGKIKAQTVSVFVNPGLNYPQAIAIDAVGNLYIANQDDNTISKVTSTGVLSTFVSTGLNGPEGIAFDASGNLFVANSGNNTVSKITPSGVVSIFDSVGLNDPAPIAFDASGNLYVANDGDNTITKITPNKVVSTFVDSGLVSPTDLAFDAAGNMYVSNQFDNTINEVTPSGVMTVFATGGLINQPTGVVFDAAGNLYVTNTGNNIIAKVTSGGVVSEFVTSGLDGPSDLRIDGSGNIFVLDLGDNIIVKVTMSGVVSPFVISVLDGPNCLALNGTGGLFVGNADDNTIGLITGNGSDSVFVSTGLNDPSGLAFDAAGNLYVANNGNNKISIITTSGVVSTFDSIGLSNPNGLAFDGSGNLYVANEGNNTISEITSSGIVSTFVGSGLNEPVGLAFDDSGNLYVANQGNNTISKVTSSGVVSTFVSTGLNAPHALVFDGLGNLFVSNEGNNTITQVTSGGVVSNFVSSGLDEPTGLAFNGLGTLYVANTGNSSISEVIFPSTWTGAASSNWNTASNWTYNALPIATSDIIIPSPIRNQPILNTDVTVNDIEIDGTLSLNGHTLTINGAVMGTGGLKGSQTSSLVIGGNAGTINFDASNNSLKDLTIAGTATLGNALNLYGTLTSTSGTLTTGSFLTLKSTSTGTAVVAPVNGSIGGTVNIERYVPKGYAAFRDLGVCVSGAGTFASSWGQLLNNYQLYTYGVSGWSPKLPTSTSLQPYTGYRTLVTGDRNPVAPVGDISYMNSDVTLAYSGTLLTGNQDMPLNGGQDKFSFISNPYASQVDFGALATSGLYDGYWYLDPTTLYGSYENYNYYGTNLGASNIYSGVTASRYLQPSQAFFVCSNTSGTPTMTFTESAKNNGNAQAAIFGETSPLNRIATGLFTGGKNVDGAVVVFNSNFSNDVGKEDGLKISNHGENLTFTVAGKDLCANGWTLPKESDELQLHLYNLNTNTAYTLRLDAGQFEGNGLEAYLKDNALNTKILLAGDSNIVSFTTTTDTSKYSNRYSIVFSPGTLPVKSINLTATQLQGTQVSLKWSVIGEESVANYKVERSTNGTSFIDLATVSPTANSNYSYIDVSSPLGAGVYYRIKATDNMGIVNYSNVAKLTTPDSRPATISIYPNPAKDIATIMSNHIASVQVIDNLGRVVSVQSLKDATNPTISVSSLPAGVYHLRIQTTDGKVSGVSFVK